LIELQLGAFSDSFQTTYYLYSMYVAFHRLPHYLSVLVLIAECNPVALFVVAA